jgi:PAS domain S-box-containing protein
LDSSNKKNVIHVLHVDDDPSLQEITKLMLLDLDSSFEIDHVCCVDEAFGKLAVEHYDVVVSDYDMPQKNGLQFLKELREQKNAAPFILFTGKGREEVAISALNLGADGYYNKQGSPETVYGELAHGIKQSVERKKAKTSVLLNEMRLQCDLDLNKMLDASDQELMDYALDSITKITQSDFAFIDLLDQDEKVMTIYSWSKTAMKECNVQIKPIHFPVSEAGIWAEPIRQRKPVIIDDYSVNMPHKKGVPEGHVTIKNFLGVPIFEKEHIVAVVAVSNKKGRYDEKDVGYITSLITDMWRLIQRKRAEDELSDKEKRFRTIFDKSFQFTLILDINGNVLEMNELCYTVHGQLAEGCLGKPFWEAYWWSQFPEVAEKTKLAIQSCQTGKIVHDEVKFIDKNLQIHHGIRIFSPITDENGKLLYISVVGLDISDRKKAEFALLESEEHFRTLAEKLPTMVFIDQKDKVVYANKKCEEDMGYSREELSSPDFKFASLISPKSIQDVRMALAKTVNEKVSSPLEILLITKEGKTLNAILNSVLINYKGEKAILGIVTDITEQKKNENEFRDSLKKFQDLTETTSDFVWETDSQGRYTYCSSQMEILWGFKPEEMIGKTPFDVMPPEDREKAIEYFGKIANSPKPFKMESSAYHKQGHLVYLETSGVPFFDGQGVLLGFRGISRDITERKKAEQEIKSLAKFPTENPLPIFRVFKNGTLLYTNPAAEKLLDHLEIRVGEAMPEQWQKTVLKALESKCRLKLEKEVNGRLFSFSVTPIVSEGYVNFYGSDITERKQTEEDLRVSEQRYRSLFEGVSGGVVSQDQNGVIIDANNVACELLGLTRDQMCGRTSFDPKWHAIKEDGSPFPGNEHPSMVALQSGKPVKNVVMGVFHPIEDAYRWIQINAEPRRDPETGQVNGVVTTFLDITHHKKIEERLKESQTKLEVLNEKLHVNGSLARHDVGNKIMAAKSNLYLLKKQIGDNPKLTKYVDNVETALASSDRIFEFSRLYEKVGSEKLVKQNVFDCFNQAVALMVNLGKVDVINQCQGLEVVADSLLNQLFYNFIDNSLKHGEKVTQIHLHYTREGDELKLFYEENGVGVPLANKAKLFDAGFTTGKGSGLGLYLTKKIIDVYGWTITETGEVGKGVCFVISIPKHNKSGKENYKIDM